MASEIERKFLVKKSIWDKLPKPSPSYLKQAYIAQEDLKVVRVRVKNNQGILTIKGKTNGISRLEFEYEIPLSDAAEMIDKLGGPVIEKDRFEINYEGNVWEVDVFYGENEGLIVAEIELASENSKFTIPNWIGKEVSDDPRYFNYSLQEKPFLTW